MRPALEDIFMGPGASVTLTAGFRWEDAGRRLRVVFAGETIANTRHGMRLHEFGRLPVYYFPLDDVRQDLLEPTDHTTESPLKGEAHSWSVRAGDRAAENAAWRYLNPPEGSPPVAGYIAFYWDKMDAWYEEDEQVFAHARDPYKRIDILPSSRHVRVVLGGQTIAETRRPYILLEPGLPTRYYIPAEDVRMDLLQPTDTTSRCPYKGQASYWTASGGDTTARDIVWTYRETLPLTTPIAHLLAFFNERVEALYVDGELQPKQVTPWSE